MKTILLLLATLCLVNFGFAQPEKTAERASPEAIYANWVDTRVDVAQAVIDDSLSVKLLALPNADMFLLNGLHHYRPAVRISSEAALARLKTERSFLLLSALLQDQDWGTRERVMHTLALFKQPRCIPLMLNVLARDSEPQLRRGAAFILSDLAKTFKDARIEPALYEALKDEDYVSVAAARSLGELNSRRSIQQIYNIVLNVKHHQLRGDAIYGLILMHHKEAIDLAIKLLPEFQKHKSNLTQVHIDDVTKSDGILRSYAGMTAARTSADPDFIPETVPEWVEWWHKAAPLFTEDMQLKQPDAQ